MVRETACLSREDRRQVDAELAGRLGSLGDRQVAAEARKVAYRLDPHAVMARVRGAAGDRRVTLRPAPDAMSHLSGLLPVAAGVAAHTALARHADAARATSAENGQGLCETCNYVKTSPGWSARPGPDGTITTTTPTGHTYTSPVPRQPGIHRPSPPDPARRSPPHDTASPQLGRLSRSARRGDGVLSR